MVGHLNSLKIQKKCSVIKINFNDVFLMTEDIPTCPNCGSRTEIILDFSHTKDATQIHQCLAVDCKFEFVLVYDSEFSEN